MSARGHNENAMRLGILTDTASGACDRIDRNDADTIDAWLAFGAALNEARAIHKADRAFGEWLRLSNLDNRVHPGDQQAAMWAAANSDQFDEARAAGKATTVRGIHAKWKEIDAARKAEADKLAEEERRAEAKAKAEAETAKAAEKAAEAAAARAEAALVQDEAVKQAAIERAERAEAEEAEAQKAAAVAEIDAADDVEATADDPFGYSSLNETGLFDLANGLRADLDDAKDELKAAKAEIDRLKEQARDLSSGNQGLAISRLHKQIVELKRARDNAIEKSAKEIRRANFMEKELKAARKSLESQEVEL